MPLVGCVGIRLECVKPSWLQPWVGSKNASGIVLGYNFVMEYYDATLCY